MRHARHLLILGASLGAHAALLAAIGPGGAGQAAVPPERMSSLSVRLLAAPAPARDATTVAEVPPAVRSRPAVAAAVPAPSAQAAHAIPVAGPRYYRGSELSRRPRALDDLPEQFAIDGVPAQNVILRLFINEEGGVDRVEAERSFLPDEQGRQLAGAFARLRFAPGLIGEAAVKSQMRIEVRLEGARLPLS